MDLQVHYSSSRTLKKVSTKENGIGPKVFWEHFSNIAYPVIAGFIFFLLWQYKVLHKIFHISTFVLPVPSRIATVIGENIHPILQNVLATLIVVVVGLMLGSLLGYLVALIGVIFPKGGSGGIAIVSAFNAVPIVALAPVFTNWTRTISPDANIRSMVAKTLVVIVICMAAMSVNAYRGLTEVPPFSEDLLKTYAVSKLTYFTKLRFPNSLPFVFIALKVSVPASIITAMVSEYFAEYIIGIGRQIRENIILSQYTMAWAYIVVACVVGMLLYLVTIIAQKLLLGNRSK
jgi:NitT/TauT family transport system permease protein